MTKNFLKILGAILPNRIYTKVRNRWHHFLRIKKEGPYTAYQRRRLWPKILATPPLYTDPVVDDGETSVHLMCYRDDHLAAIWALKSFYYAAGVSYPLVIHVQGQSTALISDTLRRHFPGAWIMLQAEADQIVEPFLAERNLANLLSLRKVLPIMQKLTDILVTAKSRRILILDTDVLFFNSPAELIGLGESRPRALFQRDYMDGYVLAKERAQAEFGIELQPQINTGIVIISPGLVDLARCERYLGRPDMAWLSGHTEQTLYALEASRQGLVSYLPRSYHVSFGGRVDCAGLKARHYSGPSRGMFTREGIPYLIRSGFLEALQTQPTRTQPYSPQLVSDGQDLRKSTLR